MSSHKHSCESSLAVAKFTSTGKHRLVQVQANRSKRSKRSLIQFQWFPMAIQNRSRYNKVPGGSTVSIQIALEKGNSMCSHLATSPTLWAGRLHTPLLEDYQRWNPAGVRRMSKRSKRLEKIPQTLLQQSQGFGLLPSLISLPIATGRPIAHLLSGQATSVSQTHSLLRAHAIHQLSSVDRFG